MPYASDQSATFFTLSGNPIESYDVDERQAASRLRDLFGAENVNRLRGEQRLYLFHNPTWARVPKAIRINNFPVKHGKPSFV